jgi:endo-1,4-beta-xylanase
MTLKNLGFPVGFAIKYELLTRAAYTAKFDSDATTLTPENELKFRSLRGDIEGEPNFTRADAIVAFAQARNIRIHGHTLLWANDGTLPKWVTDYESKPNAVANITRVIQEHITKVVTHFKGKIESWDVVNEILDDEGRFIDCVWYRVLGENYVNIAFRAAATADPNCKLFYNDVNQQYLGARFETTKRIKANLAAANIPMHGVGFQMHTNLTLDLDYARVMMKKYSDEGFLVHLSELDVKTNISDKGQTFGPGYTSREENALANFYANLFDGYKRAVDPANQYGITMWSVSDRDSHLTINEDPVTQFPMLFDSNYLPKKAYYRVLNLVSPQVNNAIVYQDFLIPVNDLKTTPTAGSSPSLWAVEGPDPLAEIELNHYGLSMTQTHRTVYNFPILNSPVSDYVLSTKTGNLLNEYKKYNPESSIQREMSLVFRYDSSNDYFAVHAQRTADIDAWRLIKRVSGAPETTLIQTSIVPAKGQVIKVVCKGPSISLFIDDVFIDAVSDSSLMTAKKFGYRMRGVYDPHSAWKYINLSALPSVADNFLLGPVGNVNGRTTNGGATAKTWTVAASLNTNNGMQVTELGLQATPGTSGRLNNATVNFDTANFSVTAKLTRTIAEYDPNRSAILIFRVKDVTNFFYLQVNNSETDAKWVLIRRVNDVNTVLWTNPFDAKDGDIIKVTASGQTISIYINGDLMGTVENQSALLTETKIGFRGIGFKDPYSAWADIQITQ